MTAKPQILVRSQKPYDVIFKTGKIHINLTILKCTIQWHLEHLQCCATITSSSKTLSSIQSETRYSLSSHFHPLLAPDTTIMLYISTDLLLLGS